MCKLARRGEDFQGTREKQREGLTGSTVGKPPDGVEVVGENHDRIDLERALFHDAPEAFAQPLDMAVVGENRLPAMGDHREEVGPAGDVGATIIAHFDG